MPYADVVTDPTHAPVLATVAYFGPAGTFTEMALDELLATVVPNMSGLDAIASPERVSLASPRAVIDAVRSGESDCGCVPFESSVEGSVPSTMDALAIGEPVQIVAEVVLDIAFTVAANAAMDASDVRTIAAYPVAAGQTVDSLERLFPQATIIPAASNAAAAQDVSSGKADAALTTALAARMHALTPLADGIVDQPDAKTRFVLITQPRPVPASTGNDRTSVILDLPNKPGSLTEAMREFADRDIDLTRIASRPRRTEPGYYFHFDAVGHIDNPTMAQALQGLHARGGIRYLGSWQAQGYNGAPPPDRQQSYAWVDGLRAGRR